MLGWRCCEGNLSSSLLAWCLAMPLPFIFKNYQLQHDNNMSKEEQSGIPGYLLLNAIL